MVLKIWQVIWIVLASTALYACSLPDGISESAVVAQLKVGAQQGDAEDQYRLGLHYMIDGEWLWDHNRGYRWFVRAAEQGHADASHMAGMAKLNGRGTIFDTEGAVEYFRLAALQGHARAQYQLAQAYLDGSGIVQDKSWGRQWLEQAAWREHKQAQFLLGALFAKGVGGQPNNAEAWRWLHRARDNGQAQAKKAIIGLEEKLTPKEKSFGQALLNRHQKVETAGLYDLPLVRYVQTVLNARGYMTGTEDGLYGPATRAAVESYAKKYNLTADVPVPELIVHLRNRSR